MNPKLSEISRNADAYVAGWLQRQPAVREESISDWLLDYFQQHSSKVRYYAFDHYQEARLSGADWDWWFLMTNGCFKLRVQAKKLKAGKDHYSDLARANQTGYQIDLLLDSSATLNFYPLYLLYANIETMGRCTKGRRAVLSICSARETYDLVFGAARQRIDSKDLLTLSIPLECLFGCPLVKDFQSVGPGKLFQNYFQAPLRAFGDGMSPELDDVNRGYEQSVPGIIQQMFDRPQGDVHAAGLIDEYESMFGGSNGALILELDQDNL